MTIEQITDRLEITDALIRYTRAIDTGDWDGLDTVFTPDAEIDYSDIRRQTGAVQWTRPGALVPLENKQQVTLRLDADVLKFFKGTGKRYQSRINAALREYVRAHRVSSS